MEGMKSLHLTNPVIYDAFKEGESIISKTLRKFSNLPSDHAHEQNNKIVNGDGGAIELTENSAELTHRMIFGPEVARVI